MSKQNLGYEIKELKSADGDLTLDLVVEGVTFARASASAQVLEDICAVLGVSRDEVEHDLREALVDVLRGQTQAAEITEITKDPQQRLRFSALFKHTFGKHVEAGLVWYNVATSETGPEDVPPTVRNKLRLEVHRLLTTEGSSARALADMHREP